MQQILIDNIEDGMVLADAVLNRYGQVLMPTDTELKQNHKKMFKMWGIKSVTIKSDEEEDSEMTPELIDAVSERIGLRLQWLPRNPIEENLVEMAIQRAKVICRREMNAKNNDIKEVFIRPKTIISD